MEAQFCILLRLQHMLDLKCVHFWCILGTRDSCMQISSYIRRLNIVRALKKKKKKMNCPASAQRKRCFLGRWLSHFALRHPSVTPAGPVLGGILECSWAETRRCFSAKWNWSGKKGECQQTKRNLKISGRRTQMGVKGRDESRGGEVEIVGCERGLGEEVHF